MSPSSPCAKSVIPIWAIPSGERRTYSWSVVYDRSCGMLGMTKTEGGPLASGPDLRGEGVRQRCRFTREVGPHFRDAGVEAGQTARVVDDEIGARALELSGHLGRDHIQRFRLLQPAITDESLEANRAVRVNEHDAIEFVGEPALEEERDVADDDAVAARVRGGDLLRAQLGDRG